MRGSFLTARTDQLEELTGEAVGALDGQGVPTYGTAATFYARAVSEVEKIVGPSGSDERTTLTVWVDGDADYIPAEGDRVTRGAVTYIVRERVNSRRIMGGALVNVRLRLREA